MNCKLKLHSKGFCYQIVGAVTVLKFLHTLASDFPHILSAIFSRETFTGKCIENFKKWF